MNKRTIPIRSPQVQAGGEFTDASAAVAELEKLYNIATDFLQKSFAKAAYLSFNSFPICLSFFNFI